jgi:hypothetical protein
MMGFAALYPSYISSQLLRVTVRVGCVLSLQRDQVIAFLTLAPLRAANSAEQSNASARIIRA